MTNDLIQELGSNFIEYAVAVNSDRAIPDAKSGLKPVAKRIIYGAYHDGFKNEKPHVKCANIVGNVMATWHPHGDSSIYGALVRLAQPWVMRYPLIDFHGSMGNRDGDGPAAYRYTEARLATIAEDGMLCGIKKNNVDYIPNYSETEDEPVTLPSLFPNLLCNPNTGIGVAMACNWLPHNLGEVANAIYDYIDGKEPMLPGPDFPTGGIIINKDSIPTIMKTGKGSVKIRGKYHIEDNTIIFDEIPYGVGTEDLMNEIGAVADEEKIIGIKNIRNESNRKGFRLAIECEKNASIATIINLLFKETSLQTSISYNQVALIDKTPTELNLKKAIEIYVNHNVDCIERECKFDIDKLKDRLEIIEGLLKALEDIDNIITLIKKSESAAAAQKNLIDKYGFTESQAKAIVDMKLGKLAGLERIELQNEKISKEREIEKLDMILSNPIGELIVRLDALVKKYGDTRRTELIQLEIPKEEQEEELVQDISVMLLAFQNGIKIVPISSYKIQKRGSKGIKTENNLLITSFKSSTQDKIYFFSNKGKMYSILCNNIPMGTNNSTSTNYEDLIKLETDEKVIAISSLKRNNEKITPPYAFFVTKKGYIKKTSINELNTNRKTGIKVINLEEDDTIIKVIFMNEEQLILTTKLGNIIRFETKDISCVGRNAKGVAGIKLKDIDEVISALPVHKINDYLALFTEDGKGKKVKLEEFTIQKRNGVGVKNCQNSSLVSALMIDNDDNILIFGTTTLAFSAKEIPLLSKNSIGNILSKNKIKKVAKI